MDANQLDKLNDAQRAAATHGRSPLLIIAGAGTGKTKTLSHRVAHLISTGTDPSRVLLLTFTRRASAEMMKRVATLLTSKREVAKVWGGTFHATANRLLRFHGASLGLADNFTVMDRSDAEDTMNDARADLSLDAGDVRFPRKGTCLSIYSRCVNASEPVEAVLKSRFPWCGNYAEQLKSLFRSYVMRKQSQALVDYDDLLLYWFHLMNDESLAALVRERFDAVLVDEYQDTNALQAAILQKLCPAGDGLTVVGDDAQSIYSFRAATVENILDFPKTFSATTVVKLEQNYRSVQPILNATNRVIAHASRRIAKDLFTTRTGGARPRLINLSDEDQQADHVIKTILLHREAGIDLRKQAVLFRAAHHSDVLEVELKKRGIPFVKFGGLKFLEAAHVKDALCFLRVAENSKDATSASRIFQLLDGIGPGHAKRAISHLNAHQFELKSLASFTPPIGTVTQWNELVELLGLLAPDDLPLPEQFAKVRDFYSPIVERRYDAAGARIRDLEQLEQISGNFPSRRNLLADLTLDPPSGTQDLAGPPLLEEDCLVLSTIHSAKGCEWDVVYVIHAADGNIPSDLATGDAEQIDEERRLFYVALTRAKDFLEVCFPLRWYAKKSSTSDRHSYAQLTRFMPADVVECFDRESPVDARNTNPAHLRDPRVIAESAARVQQSIAGMWS